MHLITSDFGWEATPVLAATRIIKAVNQREQKHQVLLITVLLTVENTVYCFERSRCILEGVQHLTQVLSTKKDAVLC